MAKFDLKKAILENKATFFGSLTEGQFSWMTQDTDQQIGSEKRNTIPVYMFDNTGKYWFEPSYEGYGEFGGMDYYKLLDQMNGGTGDREKGIDLAFNKEKVEAGEVLFPALVTKPNLFNYKYHDFTQEAEHDPNQSWYQEPEYDEDEDDFYSRDDEDEEDYDEELEENKQYYKDAEADDAEHIKALEKDMKDDKKSSKMKMSELKAKIKEMILAEVSLDVDNMEDAPEPEVDFLAELEGMLNEDEGLTPLQDYVYQYEIEISGEDQAQEFLDDIKKLNTPDDVYNYYAYDRDWLGSMDDDLENIYRQVKRKFKNLNESKGLTPLQDYVYQYEIEISGKDRAQDYLDDIKQLVTPQDVYDYYSVKRGWEGSDLKNIFKQVKTKFASLNKTDELTPLQKQAYSYAKERFGFEDAKNSLDQIKTLTTREEFSDWVKKKIEAENSLEEAKDEETDTEEVTDDVTDGEETVDVTDDFSTEEPQGPGKIDVTQNADAELTGTKKDVQDNLEAALEAARALGDEKLATQVGNTITFFNKQHVVKEDLNESMFPILKKILK